MLHNGWSKYSDRRRDFTVNNKRILFSIMALVLAAINCNAPSGQNNQSSDVNLIATITALAGGVQSASATSTFTPASAAGPTGTLPPSPTSCVPLVNAVSSVNVRSGPGTVYPAIGNLVAGGTAGIAGRSSDGTWWYIDFPIGPGGHGWVSGSVVTATCVPTSVAVVAAPPTPLPASGTCKDDYVFRLIKPSDKVCVTPASKTQADSDNAAAASRKATATYGPDTCVEGYVWRGAYTNDHVCVTPDVHSQALSDNAAASSRWTSGAFGAHTCIAGFVWREARSSDDVCVTTDVRSQTQSDNAAAASRKVTATYGPDTCATGFVWRAAFSSDHVCVTPAVYDQVAADNAAAPAHTWP
jgi:hypothetical protein